MTPAMTAPPVAAVAAADAANAPLTPASRRTLEFLVPDATTLGAAAVAFALGGMLGGAALGVKRASRLAASARPVPRDSTSPLADTAPTATTSDVPQADEAPPMDDADDVAPSPHASPRAPAPRAIGGTTRAIDSAAYHVPDGRVTGYHHGQPLTIRVKHVDGRPVEVHTATAFERMRATATRAGVHLRIISGFRTMEHQRALYQAYRTGRGNLAALPGRSNHQSGHALDLNVSAPGVLRWLDRNAQRYGFRRTVPTESWHWEHW
jgi:hypothetical protein